MNVFAPRTVALTVDRDAVLLVPGSWGWLFRLADPLTLRRSAFSSPEFEFLLPIAVAGRLAGTAIGRATAPLLLGLRVRALLNRPA